MDETELAEDLVVTLVPLRGAGYGADFALSEEQPPSKKFKKSK